MEDKYILSIGDKKGKMIEEDYKTYEDAENHLFLYVCRKIVKSLNKLKKDITNDKKIMHVDMLTYDKITESYKFNRKPHLIELTAIHRDLYLYGYMEELYNWDIYLETYDDKPELEEAIKKQEEENKKKLEEAAIKFNEQLEKTRIKPIDPIRS